MRLINLTKCYFYEPIKEKNDGEISTKWKFKNEYLLNKQQDVNELDKNMAGYIDFEVVKLRTDKKLDINKNDGVAFEKLENDEKGFTIKKPSHTIIGLLNVGRCTTYTINTYHGE